MITQHISGRFHPSRPSKAAVRTFQTSTLRLDGSILALNRLISVRSSLLADLQRSEARQLTRGAIGIHDILDREIYVPTTIEEPQRLYQHRSIVNTALFHPTLPLLYTCGIEKVIRVHSTSPSASSRPAEQDVSGEGGEGEDREEAGKWIPREKRIDDDKESDVEEDAQGMLPSEATLPLDVWQQISSRRENLRTLELFDSYLLDDVEPLWLRDNEELDSEDGMFLNGEEARLALDFPEYDSDNPGAGGRGDDDDAWISEDW